MTAVGVLPRIEILAPALPPRLDGIGDYCERLATQLATSAGIKILTASNCVPAAIPGVAVETAFAVEQPRSVRQIAERVATDRPDWLLLQYNPFSYGRWGWNPYLPQVLRGIRRSRGGPRLAVMVHEPFVPATSCKLAIMTTWQRWQLWMLGRSADVLFFSTEAWTQRFQRWFPGKPLWHLPVGSNIPRTPTSHAAARAHLGIQPGTVVLGLFGTAHASRRMDWVRAAAQTIQHSGRNVLVLAIGLEASQVSSTLAGIPTRADGPLPAAEVSRRFAALDLYLAPFIDGISTRRTSVMTAFQHGIATVGTCGRLTDTVLLKENGRAFLLARTDALDEFQAHVLRSAADIALRGRLGQAAEQLYRREFAWSQIAPRLLSILAGTS